MERKHKKRTPACGDKELKIRGVDENEHWLN
jgi:hypothetical protein